MAVDKLAIFEAFADRFDSYPDLRKVGRKLSMNPESSRPWTEFEFVNYDLLDTFDDDIELHGIRMTFHGSSRSAKNASAWLLAATDAFDDGTGISIPGFSVGGMTRQPGDDGPTRNDAVWEASAEWELMLTRSVNVPATRGN